MSPTIENGFVFLPEEAPWLAEYLAELLAFPAGRHDDQVDSTSQALAWAKQRHARPGGQHRFALCCQPTAPRLGGFDCRDVVLEHDMMHRLLELEPRQP